MEFRPFNRWVVIEPVKPAKEGVDDKGYMFSIALPPVEPKLADGLVDKTKRFDAYRVVTCPSDSNVSLRKGMIVIVENSTIAEIEHDGEQFLAVIDNYILGELKPKVEPKPKFKRYKKGLRKRPSKTTCSCRDGCKSADCDKM